MYCYPLLLVWDMFWIELSVNWVLILLFMWIKLETQDQIATGIDFNETQLRKK